MTIPGVFDKFVGIQYSVEKSIIMKKSMWFTVSDFTFYYGPPEEKCWITVPKGYFTDGASVPRFLWSIFPPWGVYGQAAILHDYLMEYRNLTSNGRDPLLLDVQAIDKIFYSAMKACSTPVWIRAIIYASVKIYHKFWK